MSSTPPYSSYPDPYGARYASSRPSLSLAQPPERRIGGVCAGIARTMGMNVTWLRVLLLLSVFLTSGATIALYALLWLVMPDDEQPADHRAYGALGAPAPPVVPMRHGSATAYQPVGGWADRGWSERPAPGATWGPMAHPSAGPGVSQRPAAFHVDPATYNPIDSVYAEAEQRIDRAVKAQRGAGAAGSSPVPTPAPSHNVVPIRPRPSDYLGERII